MAQITKTIIRGYKGIDFLELDYTGHSVIIVEGDNGVGKTSFLEAVMLPLTGGRWPDQVVNIRSGKPGRIEDFVTDNDGQQYKIVAEWSEKNPRPEISLFHLGAAGSITKPKAVKAPVQQIRKIMGNFAFDPFDIFNMTGEEQVNWALGCLGVDPTQVKVIDTQLASAFETRTKVGRRVDDLKALTEEKTYTAEQLALFAQYKEPEEVSGRHTTMLLHNQQVENAKKGLAKLQEEGEALQVQLEEIQRQIGVNSERKIAGRKWIDDPANALKPAENIAAVELELKELGDHNLMHAEIKAFKEKLELLQKTSTEWDELNASVKKYREDKEALIIAAGCPVEGLEFTDAGICLDGLPMKLDQESTGKIMSALIRLHWASNPPSRIIRISNAGLMSKKTFKQLITEIGPDVKIFAERVSDEEQLQFKFIDETGIIDVPVEGPASTETNNS